MQETIKIKIGDFSRLNQVTIKTLRYYEEIGLLIPFEVDDWTGYRYYNVAQMNRMEKIRNLKKMGFSLEEIREIIENRDGMPTLEMVEEKLSCCQNEIDALFNREKELKAIQQHMKEKERMQNYEIKTLPRVIVASHRQIIKSYQDLFQLCPNVIGPEMARLGCECSQPGYCFTIDHNKEYKGNDIDIEYCEAVIEKKQDSELIQFKELPAVEKALVFKHFGSYTNLPQSWAQIFAYLEENNYQIIDFPRFCYIDGIWNKENESEWLTEIQVPIKQTNCR